MKNNAYYGNPVTGNVVSQTIRVGLIGFGTVGKGVVKLLLEENQRFTRDRPFDLELVRIADLDITTDRCVNVPSGMLTTNADDILDDNGIDIVLELIGGIEPACSFVLKALGSGKTVVTANKALLAERGSEIFSCANENSRGIFFEAAVQGGVPIIRSITQGLNANRIESIFGILNGTTNYILTRMTEDHADYETTLKDAMEKGYAESDPTNDVTGKDALHKLILLIRIAMGSVFLPADIYCEGIEKLTVRDIEYAAELGYRIKLLAIAKRTGDKLEARVHPTMIPAGTLMADVSDEFNAVEIMGSCVGREIFYGKGAGEMPTASAVVSDIVEAARRIVDGSPCNVSEFGSASKKLELIPVEEIETQYYLRLQVNDQPGVLASIATILAREKISIQSVIQKGQSTENGVTIILLTHIAREWAIQKAIKDIETLDVVMGPPGLYRIEEI